MNDQPTEPTYRETLNPETDKLTYVDEVLLVFIKDAKKNGSLTAPLEMIAAGISGLQKIPLETYSVEEWNQIIVELMVLLKQNFRRPLEVEEAMSGIKEGGEKTNGIKSTNSKTSR